jgi:di/tricarboxylate transporter
MSVDPGIIALIVFGIMVITFCINKLPPAWVSMAGCVICVLLGISTLSNALSGFTSDIIFLVAGMDILSQALLKVGLAGVIGRAIVKLSKGVEKRIMLISFCFSAVISGLLSNMTIIMIFLVIFRSIENVSDPGKFNIKNVFLPVVAGVFAGAGFTLIGTTSNLIGNQIVVGAGFQGFEFFSFLPVALGIFIVCGLIIYFYQYERGKRIWNGEAVKTGCADARTDSKSEKQSTNTNKTSAAFDSGAENKNKMYVMAGITLLTLGLLASGLVSLGTAALIGGLLSVITGCIKEKEAFSKMNWGIIIWLAGLFSMTEILNVTGGSARIAQFAISIVPEGLPLFMVFALAVLIAMSCSQVISDAVTVLIFLPAFLPIAIGLGMNPYTMAAGIIFAANLSFLTPLASGQIGIALTVGYRFSDIVRYSWLLHLAMYFVLILLIPIVFPL